MNSSELFSLVEALPDCNSISDLEALCVQFCENTHFEYYLLGICTVTSLSAPHIVTLTNYPAEWFASYFENEVQKHDPVVKYCFEKTAPITWDKLVQMEQYCTPVGHQIMAEARAKGLVNGLSIPIRAPSGQISIFSLSTCIEEKVQERLMNVLPFAQSFSYALFEAYLRVSLHQAQDYLLTPREKECLFWACEGKTSWEMATIMNVSERTAIFHLTSATKKLGASNRQHAVAKAIMHGLIKPTP